MPDPSKAMQRAFAQSFLARNWPDVLEYCLDVNAYLEKMFLTLFSRRKASVVGSKQPLLEKRVRQVYPRAGHSERRGPCQTASESARKQRAEVMKQVSPQAEVS